MQKEIDELRTRIANNPSTIINNKTTNVLIQNINYNIMSFYLLNPPEEFKEIDNNFINTKNIILFKSAGERKINGTELEDDICNAIIYRFVNNKKESDENVVLNRNVWSDSEKYNIHCYIDSKWFQYNDDEKFIDKLIKPIINQFINSLNAYIVVKKYLKILILYRKRYRS